MIKEAYYRGVSVAIEEYAIKVAEATGMEKVAIIEKLRSLFSKARGGSQEAVAETASKPLVEGALAQQAGKPMGTLSEQDWRKLDAFNQRQDALVGRADEALELMRGQAGNHPELIKKMEKVKADIGEVGVSPENREFAEMWRSLGNLPKSPY